ncbi:MAG: SDR family oxidoreductase [Planctomycetota bacterium]
MQRTVLITGASSGIGAAVARALSGHFRLILVARRKDRLQALAKEVGNAVVIAEDLTDPAACARIAAACSGGLDGLVNNAGAFATAACGEITTEHLERMLAINLRAPILLTAACLPHLRAGATIVNVSSRVVDQAFATCAAYTASKCGLEGWSRVLAEELRPRRIRVCIVAPGATDTEIWPPAFAAADRARMVRAADVAEAIRLAIEAHPNASFDRIAVTPQGGAV